METQFKKEWSPADFTKVDRKLKKFFAGKTFVNHYGKNETIPTNKNGFECCLGLPYTSSGIFACYSLSCNTNLFESKDSKFYYDYAAVTESGEVVLILSDSEENTKEVAI